MAVATAKTLAYSLNIALVGISSLYALAASTCKQYPNTLVVPLIDARRQNAYVGYYRQGKSMMPQAHASLEVIIEQLVEEGQLIFVGRLLLLLRKFKETTSGDTTSNPSFCLRMWSFGAKFGTRKCRRLCPSISQESGS